MVTVLILVFPDWKEFLHVDASSIVLDAVLTQVGKGDLDHPIAFIGENFKNHPKFICIING